MRYDESLILLTFFFVVAGPLLVFFEYQSVSHGSLLYNVAFVIFFFFWRV